MSGKFTHTVTGSEEKELRQKLSTMAKTALHSLKSGRTEFFFVFFYKYVKKMWCLREREIHFYLQVSAKAGRHTAW